jgi:hypothetical protein
MPDSENSGPRRGRGEPRVRRLLSRVVSASAGIVALSALTVSIYQAMLSREQQRMSVWPYLMQYNSGRDGGYFRVVQNAGLGPALIGWTEVAVDGRPQRTWSAVLRALVGANDSTLIYSSLPPGSVLLPAATLELIEMRAARSCGRCMRRSTAGGCARESASARSTATAGSPTARHGLPRRCPHARPTRRARSGSDELPNDTA